MGPFASSLCKDRVRYQELYLAPVKAKGKISVALMSFGSGLELGKTLEKKLITTFGKNVDELYLLCVFFTFHER